MNITTKCLMTAALLLFNITLRAQDFLDTQQIASGVFVHFGPQQAPNRANHGEIANIGFIVGASCVAVIDSGGSPQQGVALKAAIRAVTDKPVCYVINTHVHPDHIYGNAAFKSEQTQFIGHRNLARAMALRGPFYLARAAEQLDISLTAGDIIPPDLPVNRHMTINLGNRELILTAHPAAHTDNDLTVYDKQTRTIWLSDLLFVDHVPVIDGSLKGWLAELERLKKQPYRYVIPGHGPLITDWPSAMRPQYHYLTTLQTEIRDMIRQGKYLEQAVETVGQSERPNWQLFDHYHRKNVTAAFAELEWED